MITLVNYLFLQLNFKTQHMKKVYISLVAIFLYCATSAQIIVIDPGHGYGATVSNNPDGRTATEIETALEVGIRTKNLIKNSTCAWTVHLTRTTNINGWVSVDQRALMAQNWNADRLLSIHGNAGGGSGTETFYSTATGLTANTQSAAVQLAYATKVQNNMVTEGAWINRRISTDIAYLGYNLGVLKRSTTGCLNEIGFVDNATDKPKLLSTVWRDKFALAYFKAFQAELKVTCNSAVTPGAFTLTLTPECVGAENQIKLTWTASANATSYDIYRNGTLYTSGVTGLQFVNTLVIAGTTYSYVVKAKNTSGTTSNSNGTRTAIASSCAARLAKINEEVNRINEIKLFPNPASTNFSLLIDNMLNQTLEINIFNINGQNVYSSNTISYDDTFNGNINIEHLSNGIYFVKLSFNGTEQNHKLIKE